MALDTDIKAELAQYLALLESDVVLRVCLGNDENSEKVSAFIEEIVAMSPRLFVETASLSRTPSFAIDKKDALSSGILFAGIPLGHEFTSFVLALLHVSGRPPKVEPSIISQIKKIDTPLHFETYVSLTCHNCPDVVQALNIMSVTNPNISHTMIEGSMFKEEAEANDIMAVPTVMLNGETFSSGRVSIEHIIEKIVGPQQSTLIDKDPFDILVVGGGPAGASAAIYAARKGIKTGIIAETFGGQPLETLSIENIIGTKYTEGPKLMAQIEDHVNQYNVDIMKSVRATKIEKKELIEVTVGDGTILKSKAVVVATGARWRNLNIPGEQTFKNKGVAYCPHCDGPLFANKNVAVVGGGNSGIEAAIDLANIVEHVTVLEFMPELKADQVLQERLKALPNVTVLKNVETKAILGTSKVEAIVYAHRDTQEEITIPLQGVFILIGLQPNTEWIDSSIEKTRIGELIVDKKGETSVPGIFAAGDCSDTAYKQIITSMGSGASAALGAFDYLIRNT